MDNAVLKFLVELITAAISTLGFALLFRMRYRFLPIAALGGAVTYAVYFAVSSLSSSLLAAAFAAAFFMSVFSEICARILKASAIIFILPFAISIVPGSYLYYTMSNLLSQNDVLFRHNLHATLEVSIGMAVGITVATVFFGTLLQLHRLRNKKSS